MHLINNHPWDFVEGMIMILYNKYKIHRSSLALIHDLCINLSCADIAMTEQLRHSVFPVV